MKPAALHIEPHITTAAVAANDPSVQLAPEFEPEAKRTWE
jgi:hypothetical protein